MRIGIDIDNCISNFDDVLLEEYLKHDKELRNTGIINDKPYHITVGMFDWSKEENDDFYYNNIQRIAMSLKPLNNAKDVIDKLKADGNEIYIITSRDNGEYINPEKMTREWLEKYDIYFDRLILTGRHEKGPVCKENNIDIMIEDSIKNCEDIENNGVKCYIMNTRYKQEETRFERVKTWNEIYSKISKLYKKNESKNLLIEKDNIEKVLTFYNINIEDYKDKCYKCLDDINKNSELKNKINYVLKFLYSNESEQLELLWKESNLNKFLGESYNKFIHNIILLSGYKIHEENMCKYNFDTYQVLAHKNRVRECLINDIYNLKLKGIRLSQLLWGLYFVKIKLIEVGRLQYEYCNNKKGKYIKIHIPKGDKLLYNEVLNSIKNSKKEIKKYFNIENYEYYCESWLLSKDITKLLDSNSNIAKFQQLFDITEGKDAIKDILNFVFDLQQIDSYYNLPERTSLQSKIKDLLINGKEIHIGIGKLKKI